MRPSDNDESSTQSQDYEANFKRWMKLHAPRILPTLVPGVQYKRMIGMKVFPVIMYTDMQDEDEDETHRVYEIPSVQ